MIIKMKRIFKIKLDLQQVGRAKPTADGRPVGNAPFVMV